MASLFHNIKANLSENKEDWYNICQEAESALFRVKNACGDEVATKTLERMILELNNIRMEKYEALTEYALVEESFGGNFEGKKITTNLHNDKTNPIWIIGDISIDDTNYRVNAKVFQEPSEFGIDKGPVSKLYIAREDKFGESTAVINYDRGWDVKPTEETEEVYNIALGAVCSYRNSHPYEADPEPVENINESVKGDSLGKKEFIDYCKGKVKDLGTVKIKGEDTLGYAYIDEEDENKVFDIRVDCIYNNGFKSLNAEDTLEAFGTENSYLQGKKFVDGGEMDQGILWNLAELDFKYIDTNFYNDLLDNWDSWEMPMRFEETLSNKEEINESVDEDDYIDPNYKVDIRNLNLTNGGYHNNSNAIYGRIKLSPKGDLEPGVYDIIYLPEGEYLYVFKPGTDVKTAVDYLYMNDGFSDNKWVKWNGRRIQLEDINKAIEETSIEPPIEQYNSMVSAIIEAYFNDNPIPLNRVNYQ